MSAEPERKSENGDSIETESAGETESKAENASDAPDHSAIPPACPRCGWSNTRPSHTRTVMDPVLELISLRAFRCRSCGNRFRVFRRRP
jgi:hypothetical protein